MAALFFLTALIPSRSPTYGSCPYPEIPNHSRFRKPEQVKPEAAFLRTASGWHTHPINPAGFRFTFSHSLPTDKNLRFRSMAELYRGGAATERSFFSRMRQEI